MALFGNGLRGVGALATALVLTLGCGGKKSSDSSSSTETVTISGTVTYTRIPLKTDPTTGIPTGLDTANPKTGQAARGVVVRLIHGTEETDLNGNKTTVWSTAATTTTSSTGKYSFSGVVKGDTFFVEVIGIAPSAGLRLIQDPAGIGSHLPINDRPMYGLRKGADGSASATNPVPGVAANADATVDFDVTLTTPWWKTMYSAAKANQATLESTGTGSRVLAILDSLYSFADVYGSPALGSVLDLHYCAGRSEGRSYVEFDRDKNYQIPDAADPSITTNAGFDGSTIHYFGSLQGDPTNDDAWDEGVLFPMFSRMYMYAQGFTPFFPPSAPLTNLSPDLAILEGFSDAMAANLLHSPYLADTANDTTGALLGMRNISDISGLIDSQKSPYSAPNIAALCWALTLKANSVTAPGTPTQWAAMDEDAILRLFTVTVSTDDDVNSTSYVDDLANIFDQLALLQNTQSSGEPVDLKTIFTDTALTSLCAPFNIPWPRPTTTSTTHTEYASFLKDWGKNPDTSTTAIPAITFTMSDEQLYDGSYANLSAGDVVFARFTLSKPVSYRLQLGTSLPAGATLELHILSTTGSYYYRGLFTPSTLGSVTLPNMLGDTSPLAYYSVRLRLLSPGTLQSSPIPVNISLTPNL